MNRIHLCLRIAALLAVHLVSSGAIRSAVAQEPGSELSSESEPLVLDFTPQNANRKVRFLPAGLAYELEVEFLLRTAKRQLRAKLPEAGEFEVELDPRCEFVQCGEPKPMGREVHVELLTKLPALTPEALQGQVEEAVRNVLAGPLKKAAAEADSKKKEDLTAYFTGLGLRAPDDEAKLKPLYATRRARVLGTAELLAALQELAKQRPLWVPPVEQQKWKGLKGPQLAEIYERLLQLDIGEKYLRACGLQLDTSKRGFDTLVQARLEGVHALRSGGGASGEDRSRASARALPPEDASRLRRAFTAAAVCRFLPRTDADDPNSLWLGGQRVSCRLEGLASRVVSGRLHAARHDPTDWWTLLDYDPQRVRLSFRGGDQIVHEVFQDGRHGRLRVSSLSPEAQAYTFELSPLGDAINGPVVRVEEVSGATSLKFPF